MVVTFGWWLVGPKARRERSDSEVPLPWIVDSESVGVNGVRAEVHQLVDPLAELIIQGVGSVAVGLDLLDGFLAAVGHVDDQLLVDGVGEEHDPLGVSGGGGVVLPHVFKIIDPGAGA